MTCYRFIASVEVDHSVARSCHVLGVSRSSFYAWRQRCRLGRVSARVRADTLLTERIVTIHQESHGTYGSPRVHAELRAQGIRCGRRRVERLMQRAQLRGCTRQVRRVRTTVSDPAATPAADLVERAFAPAVVGGPDRVWVADISYVATGEGWLYLAAVLDCFSRRVVGWSMADHLRTELVLDALTMALQRRQPRTGLIHHSDHGCQYTALTFGAQLRAAGLVASMGSVGDCFDRPEGPRRRRELFRHAQSRVALSRHVGHQSRRTQRHLPFHRDVVQHPPPALHPWLSQPGRL